METFKTVGDALTYLYKAVHTIYEDADAAARRGYSETKWERTLAERISEDGYCSFDKQVKLGEGGGSMRMDVVLNLNDKRSVVVELKQLKTELVLGKGERGKGASLWEKYHDQTHNYVTEFEKKRGEGSVAAAVIINFQGLEDTPPQFFWCTADGFREDGHDDFREGKPPAHIALGEPKAAAAAAPAPVPKKKAAKAEEDDSVADLAVELGKASVGGTCAVVLSTGARAGQTCGRRVPCQYHK